MKVRVITRAPVAAGFELAGLGVTCVDDGHAAADVVKRWASDAEIGVVLIDHTLYAALPSDLLRRIDRQALPVFASIPAPRWDGGSDAEAYVLEILRQAIGYQVRPR